MRSEAGAQELTQRRPRSIRGRYSASPFYDMSAAVCLGRTVSNRVLPLLTTGARSSYASQRIVYLLNLVARPDYTRPCPAVFVLHADVIFTKQQMDQAFQLAISSGKPLGLGDVCQKMTLGRSDNV